MPRFDDLGEHKILKRKGINRLISRFEHGVNFIDTAEMYPATPVSAQTQGRTEEIIGTWFESRGKRRSDNSGD